MSRIRRALVVSSAVLAAVAALAPAASADRAYTERFGITAPGAITSAANTLLTCPTAAPNCANARAGTGAVLDNDNFAMTAVDVDGDLTTFNSSSATLTVPLGSEVLWAALYWSADTSAGASGSAAPTPASKDSVSFRAPGALAPSTVTAVTLDTDAQLATRYQGVADVTQEVAAAGSGTYTIGNVQTGTGTDRYAGWALVVAYRDATQPVRRLAIFDGFTALLATGADNITVTLNNMLTSAGSVAANMTLLNWEGDRSVSTERIKIGTSKQISDALNPTDNVPNSTISSGGAHVTTKNPNYVNQLGFDLDTINVDGDLPTNATSETMNFKTTSDAFLPAAVALSAGQAAGVPASSARPAISGTAQETQTLTASTGTWTGTAPITYAYQWQRCNAAGTACVNVVGATSSTYTLGAADLGSRMRVVVTATNSVSSSSAASLVTAVVTGSPPVNTVAPTVTGTARENQTLSASTGTWTGSATITFGYQWQRCDDTGANCTSIAGATSPTYILGALDVGGTVKVAVTGTNGYGDATATSTASGVVVAAAPVNTAVPTISGTPADGQTLTASPGTWTGDPVIGFDYQWVSCAADGGSCTDVLGATASTYVLTSGDVGRRFKVRVTGTNGAGSSSALSALTSTVDAVAPQNATPPSVSGTPTDGQTLTADDGTWTGSTPLSFARQWVRCDAAGDNCADIAGETGTTLLLGSSDVGDRFKVRVTASNGAGDASATSALTSAVAAVAPQNQTVPTVSGTELDGETLTADPGTWTGSAPITFTYAWERCNGLGADCAPIVGEAASTYVLTDDDIGSTIRVVVTATNAGGGPSQPSAVTGPIAAIGVVNQTLPSIGGTPTDGETLTADDGTWTGSATITYARQWERCDGAGLNCAPIVGETASTYVLTSDDVDSTVRVVVTASNAAGPVSATSLVTSVVAGVSPANTAPPTIGGTPTDGETLTADDGTWSGSTPMTFTHQWQRCDALGDACVEIAGATGQTYELTSDDVGATIRVDVTAANGTGTETARSAATGPVAAIPPANLTPPSISGTATDGETLTADPGTWSGSATIAFTYQWERCNGVGGDCTDVPGATDQTFDLTSADVGSTLRVRVTATNAADSASARSNATGVVAAIPPSNVTPPSVGGTPTDGQTLTADDGTWAGSQPIALTRQWERCNAAGTDCSPISGETGATYVLTGADAGKTVRVVVTATNAADAASEPSAATAVIASAQAQATTPPAITGAPTQGVTLTASTGTWTGTAPITYEYRWQRCNAAGTDCTDLPGATGPTHLLEAGDVGSTIRVVVTATNGAGGVSSSSAVTEVIAGLPGPGPAPTPTPDPAPAQAPPPTADDLGTIDGGLLTGAQCRQVVTGLGFRRLNAPGIGAIRLRMKADGAVAPDAPLGLALTAPASKLRSVKLQLDGRALRTSGGRGRWTAAVAPKAFADGDVHTLLVTATPRKGTARTMTETIRTAACATRYTAGQWRTNVGTGLRLRVDSRTALGSVSFPLPASLTGGDALKPRKGLGRLRFVQAGGRRTILQLGVAKAPAGTLLDASATGGPSVRVTGRTIIVRGLPAGTGIAELTLYRTGSRLLKTKPGLQARAIGVGGAPATLKTRLQRVTGR